MSTTERENVPMVFPEELQCMRHRRLSAWFATVDCVFDISDAKNLDVTRLDGSTSISSLNRSLAFAKTGVYTGDLAAHFLVVAILRVLCVL